MKIGVMVDSFRVGLEAGIAKAVEVGAQGVQIYAVQGEMAPENLSAARRSEIRRSIEDRGLVVSALCGDLGGHGFALPEEHPWRIEKSKLDPSSFSIIIYNTVAILDRARLSDWEWILSRKIS